MDAPLHFSQLRNMARSPAHYRSALETPRADTPSMRLGRLVHTLVLGGPPFVVFDGTRRGKAWTDFEAAHGGLEIVTVDEEAVALEIAASIRASDVAQMLLGGMHELELSWEIAGRKCAGRLDVLGHDGKYVTELKTTTDAEPGRFMRTASRLAYPSQLDWYGNGLVAAGMVAPENYYIVAVETKPPYVVTPFEVTPHALELGRRTWRSWFERLRVCEESNSWPGYTLDIYPLDVPDDDYELGGEEAA